MKLILRRQNPCDLLSPYRLQTDDGEDLPNQSEVVVCQQYKELTKITVTFFVDEKDVWIEGSNG